MSFVCQDKLNIVMECLGESMEKRLNQYLEKSTYFQEKELLILMENILRALLEIHRQNMVHLDIKPANILVNSNINSEIEYKLCDFGLARNKSNNNNEDIDKGDSRYLA